MAYYYCYLFPLRLQFCLGTIEALSTSSPTKELRSFLNLDLYHTMKFVCLSH